MIVVSEYSRCLFVSFFVSLIYRLVRLCLTIYPPLTGRHTIAVSIERSTHVQRVPAPWRGDVNRATLPLSTQSTHVFIYHRLTSAPWPSARSCGRRFTRLRATVIRPNEQARCCLAFDGLFASFMVLRVCPGGARFVSLTRPVGWL